MGATPPALEHRGKGIVEETYLPGASVSLIARRHGIAGNQLFNLASTIRPRSGRELTRYRTTFAANSSSRVSMLTRLIGAVATHTGSEHFR